MADTNSTKAIFDEPERTLKALAMELKHPLTTIAARAELGGDQAYADIMRVAEQSLNLIDSYLLMARSEYGQAALDLEPLGLGSVLHEVAQQAKPLFAASAKITIDDRAHEPVMTNRAALSSIILAAAEVLSGPSSKSAADGQVVFRSYKSTNNTIGVGIFTAKPLAAEDLKHALELYGRAQMPLASVSNRSGVSLVIAESLCRAIGGHLEVKRMGRLMGLATVLPKSEQLALI